MFSSPKLVLTNLYGLPENPPTTHTVDTYGQKAVQSALEELLLATKMPVLALVSGSASFCTFLSLPMCCSKHWQDKITSKPRRQTRFGAWALHASISHILHRIHVWLQRHNKDSHIILRAPFTGQVYKSVARTLPCAKLWAFGSFPTPTLFPWGIKVGLSFNRSRLCWTAECFSWRQAIFGFSSATFWIFFLALTHLLLLPPRSGQRGHRQPR